MLIKFCHVFISFFFYILNFFFALSLFPWPHTLVVIIIIMIYLHELLDCPLLSFYYSTFWWYMPQTVYYQFHVQIHSHLYTERLWKFMEYVPKTRALYSYYLLLFHLILSKTNKLSSSLSHTMAIYLMIIHIHTL